MTTRTWTDGGGLALDAANLNALEADLTAATTTANGAARASSLVAPAPSGDTTGVADQAALQPLVTQAQNTGGTLILQAGTYYVTGLTTTASFIQPRILGQGMRQTILTVVGSGAGIKFNGGSGQPGGGLIADLQVTGASATGIIFQGVNECYAQRVWFKTLAVGVKFFNELLSNFTEFCVVKDSTFNSDVALPVWYARANSVESFHGSGLISCNISAPSSTGPAVQIDTGCFPYGAPLDGTIFCRTNNQTLIVNNNSARIVSFRGGLDVEIQQSATGITVGGGTGGVIAYEGNIGALGGVSSDVTMGSLYLTQSVFYTGSSTYIQRRPWIENKALGTGTTDLLTSGSIGACLMHVEINSTTTSYNYVYTLSVWRDSFNGNTGGVTILATHKSLNAAGYGAPTFGYANGRPQITNASYPATGLVAYSEVIPFSHDRSDSRFPQYH